MLKNFQNQAQGKKEQPIRKQVTEHQDFLMSKAMQLTRHNKEAANNLFQNTVLKIIEEASTSVKNFRPWAARVMTNVYADHFRSQNTQQRGGRQVHLQIDDRTVNEETLNTALETLGMDFLMTVINKLPQKHKTAFLLRHEGYSYEEIAQKMNIDKNSVSPYIVSAKKELQRII